MSPPSVRNTNRLDTPKRWFIAQANVVERYAVEHYLELGMEPFAVTDSTHGPRLMYFRIFSSIEPVHYSDRFNEVNRWETAPGLGTDART